MKMDTLSKKLKSEIDSEKNQMSSQLLKNAKNAESESEYANNIAELSARIE